MKDKNILLSFTFCVENITITFLLSLSCFECILQIDIFIDKKELPCTGILSIKTMRLRKLLIDLNFDFIYLLICPW